MKRKKVALILVILNSYYFECKRHQFSTCLPYAVSFNWTYIYAYLLTPNLLMKIQTPATRSMNLLFDIVDPYSTSTGCRNNAVTLAFYKDKQSNTFTLRRSRGWKHGMRTRIIVACPCLGSRSYAPDSVGQ